MDKFKKKLTEKEIQNEIDKTSNYFEQIPDELKEEAAIHFIVEIVNWSCMSIPHGLGIFTEATFRFREIALEVLESEEEDDAEKEE